MSLPPDFPLKAGPARDKAILDAVDGGLVTPRWTNITSSIPGHEATFQVLADGLSLGGVRLNGSATLLQKVADKLGASLMTPRLLDLAFLQATAVIPPLPMWPADDSTASMVKESQKMDAAIDALKGGKRTLVAPIGKNWVLSNALLRAKPGHAALYGWAVASEWRPLIPKIPTYPGTLPGIQNIQPLATPHDAQYTDYAMLMDLVRRQCVVDGQPMDLLTVLRNPELAPLASHEGALQVLRQPGVPVLPPLAPLMTSGADGGDPKSIAPESHVPGLIDVRQEPNRLIKKSLFHLFLRLKFIPVVALTGLGLGYAIGTVKPHHLRVRPS
jgi:hypothetical protein